MFYLLLAVFIWAFSYGLVKQNLTGIDPYFASFLRLCLASLFFLPFFRTRGLSLHLALRFLWIGGIQYGFMYCLYLQAVHYLHAYEVALFTLFVPLYINLLQDFYARQFQVINWLLTAVGMLGALVIQYQTPDWNHLKNGFLLMQGANFLFALGMIQYRQLMKGYPEIKDYKIYFLLFIGAALFAGVATHLCNGWSSYVNLDQKTIIAIVYLSLIATGIGFFSWNKGVTIAVPSTTAVVSLLKVPLGVLASIVFFGNQTDWLRLGIGLGLILLSIGVSELRGLKSSQYK